MTTDERPLGLFLGAGWERLRIEFEFLSSNFKAHKHDPKECDLIVCREHDWAECPVEVIALRDVIRGLPNPHVARPEDAKEVANESALDELVTDWSGPVCQREHRLVFGRRGGR